MNGMPDWFTADCPENARPAQGIIVPRTAVLPPGVPPLTGIIHHGELAPTDRYHCTHANQVSRLDEADAGEPSPRRSHHHQEGLRLFPEAPRRPNPCVW